MSEESPVTFLEDPEQLVQRLVLREILAPPLSLRRRPRLWEKFRARQHFPLVGRHRG